MYRIWTPMVLAAVVWLLPAGALQASITLPPPDMVVDGVPLSSQSFAFGDDFVTYSTRILVEMQDRYPTLLPIAVYGDFNSEKKAGVGNQDVIIYTQAGGQANPASLDDPLDAVTGNTSAFSDTWGDANPVTVGEILGFLPSGSTTPVFAFDHNQTGNELNLFIQGYVQVLDGDDNTVLDTWYFDAVNNGAEDAGSPVLSQGEITVTPLTTAEFTVKNNAGSGAADFWGYAPTMDLSVFDSHDKFIVYMNLSGLNNGGEELFIAGGVAVGGVVPEMPSGLVWLGLLAVVASGVKWKGRF
jgi:hypothetical protein